MYMVNLVQASEEGHLNIVEYLLSKGTNRELKNNDDKNAYDVAATEEIKQLLKKYEKRLCIIVSDELGKRYRKNVFNDLRINDYL